MQTNFQSKVISSGKNMLVYLVSAKTEGKPAWYYVKVDEPKHKEFQRQMATGSLNLADFGTILHSGWGEEPARALQAMVEEEYGAMSEAA